MTGVQIEVRNDAENSGTRATLDLTTEGSAGTVHLVVRDAANATVYDADLPANLVTSSALGTAGNWHVNVTLTW